MHVVTEPAILYLGTPVVVISTLNEDGSPNLAPMSSAFWLGWRCVLGLDASSKTPQNMLRTGECVLNLPSEAQVAAVNRLALTTGSNPVTPRKMARGYRYEPDKFGVSGLTPARSDTVAPPRVRECPVQLEAVVESVHGLAEGDERLRGRTKIFELRIQRVHVEEALLLERKPNHIDPDKWRPLIMSFQRFYGLAPGELEPSRLAQVAEAHYRSPDVDRARSTSAAPRP
ncbi:MAG TPA: flavin reductase family protein [Stellaceae bacterium]|nr:flavin reductase family protein [Stellaceae bacterium]